MSPDNQKRESSVRRRVSVEREADEYAQRHFVNLVSAAFLLLLAVAMVWTVKAFDRQETLRKCFASGRKDCVQITAPSAEMRQAVR
jgi:hypothetical protein